MDIFDRPVAEDIKIFKQFKEPFLGLDIAQKIEALSTIDLTGDLQKILGLIADLPTEAAKDIFISKLTKRTGTTKKAILQDIKNLVARRKAENPITKLCDPGFTDEEKQAAIELLKSPSLVRSFLGVCHLRYVGRDTTLVLIKLATLTRHLERGLSVVVSGTSSVGKSELIGTVVMTCVPTDVESFSRTSAQYLAYRNGPLEHKVVIFYEFNGADSSSAMIRTALTEGELRLGTVQKDASGALSATEIRKETKGLVILSTYTGSEIDTELSTRVLLQEITHDEDLAREVYRRKAQATEDHSRAFRMWQAADSLIEAKDVAIPYLKKLADIFPTSEERFHRDYDKTVTLIKASALLHQYQRDITNDGKIIANEDDYRLVYSLGNAFAQSLLPVSEPALRMLDTAKDMGKPTRAELQKRLGVSCATIKRYIRQAKQAELIDTEGRGQSQTIAVLDVPMSRTVLPDPDEIFMDRGDSLSQSVQTADKSHVTVDQPSLSRAEPSELLADMDDEIGSNGSDGPDPSQSPVTSHITPIGSTDHGINDDVFAFEEGDTAFPDLCIEGM